MTAWCPECAAVTQIITPEVATLVSGISLRALHRWVEEGKLHFLETEDGLLFICLASLQAVS